MGFILFRIEQWEMNRDFSADPGFAFDAEISACGLSSIFHGCKAETQTGLEYFRRTKSFAVIINGYRCGPLVRGNADYSLARVGMLDDICEGFVKNADKLYFNPR